MKHPPIAGETALWESPLASEGHSRPITQAPPEPASREAGSPDHIAATTADLSTGVSQRGSWRDHKIPPTGYPALWILWAVTERPGPLLGHRPSCSECGQRKGQGEAWGGGHTAPMGSPREARVGWQEGKPKGGQDRPMVGRTPTSTLYFRGLRGQGTKMGATPQLTSLCRQKESGQGRADGDLHRVGQARQTTQPEATCGRGQHLPS